MTIINLHKYKNKYIVEAQHHADDSILCSSISTLLYTLACYVEDKAEELKMEPGDAKIIYTLDSDIPYEMVKGCFEMLKEEYPEKIILNIYESLAK